MKKFRVIANTTDHHFNIGDIVIQREDLNPVPFIGGYFVSEDGKIKSWLAELGEEDPDVEEIN